jgi:hypothetical protein
MLQGRMLNARAVRPAARAPGLARTGRLIMGWETVQAAVPATARRAGSGRRSAGPVMAAKKEIMMWEALREAIDEEMERDPTVCVMGKRQARIADRGQRMHPDQRCSRSRSPQHIPIV